MSGQDRGREVSREGEDAGEERCWTLGGGPVDRRQQPRRDMAQRGHALAMTSHPDVRLDSGDTESFSPEPFRRVQDAGAERAVVRQDFGVDVSSSATPLSGAAYRSLTPTKLSLFIPSSSSSPSSSLSTLTVTSRNKQPSTSTYTATNNALHSRPRSPPQPTSQLTSPSPAILNCALLRPQPNSAAPPAPSNARGTLRLAGTGVRDQAKLSRLSVMATTPHRQSTIRAGFAASACGFEDSEISVSPGGDVVISVDVGDDVAAAVMAEEKKRVVEVDEEDGAGATNNRTSESYSRQQLDRRRPQIPEYDDGLGTIDRILDDFPGGAELHATPRHSRAISPSPSTLDPSFNGRTTPSSFHTLCNRDSRISWGSISTLCDEEGKTLNRASLTKYLGTNEGGITEKCSPVTEEEESPSSAHQRHRRTDTSLPIIVEPTPSTHSSSPPKTPINNVDPNGVHLTYPPQIHYAKSDPDALSSHTLSYSITPTKDYSSRSSRTLFNATPTPPRSPSPRSPILPQKTPRKPLRELRYILLIVYRRLFSFLLLLNILALLLLLLLPSSTPTRRAHRTRHWTAHLATLNLTAAVLVRQDHVVNLLYYIFCTVPRRTWPLWVRQQCAKIYHLGGVHSGAATCSVAWFAGSVGQAMRDPSSGMATLIISWFGLSLLVAMIISAIPQVRKRYHNRFELVHRFAGWSALAVFWAENVSSLNDMRGDRTLGYRALRSLDIWCLVLVTLSIASSWFRLRKVPVEAEVLSNHAVRLWFRYGKPLPGSFTRMSTRPLTEWHSFAAIPVLEESEHGVKVDLEKGVVVREKQVEQGVGYSVIVSNAGDWTEWQIQHPPTELWVRGLPTCGVMHIARLFTRLVLVGTGSGIGPLLSHLQLPCPQSRGPVRLIWSTPSPRTTFGERVCEAVVQADPEAVIYDTKRLGRPDLVKMAWRVAREWGAEGVVVIANERVTKKVVYGLRTRGVAAYGAIWDS